MSGKHEPRLSDNERLMYLIVGGGLLALLMYVTAALMPA